MLDLSKITLCAISSVKIKETLKALEICNSVAKFNKTIFFSDQKVKNGFLIPKIQSTKDYNSFVLYTLPELVNNYEYILTIHWDGFIINPNSWIENFYEYDYIGAPWPCRNDICGNGGFCLKSNKFFINQKIILQTYNNIYDLPEDLILSFYLRNFFIDLGCKYAPPEIAYKFSIEHPSSKYYDPIPFGFHDFRPNPQYEHKLYT
jgi:hypothetical protein